MERIMASPEPLHVKEIVKQILLQTIRKGKKVGFMALIKTLRRNEDTIRIIDLTSVLQ